MKSLLKVLLAVFLVLLVASPLFMAQEQKRHGRHIMEKVKEKLSLLKMWKMIDYLDLDEETGVKVFQVVKKYDEEYMTLMRNAHELVFTLKKELSKEKQDKTKIQSLVNQLRSNADQAHAIIQQRIDEISKILPLEKVAKYIIFELEFRQEIAKIAQRAMRGEGQRSREAIPPPDD
jgi:hypothetical protein